MASLRYLNSETSAEASNERPRHATRDIVARGREGFMRNGFLGLEPGDCICSSQGPTGNRPTKNPLKGRVRGVMLRAWFALFPRFGAESGTRTHTVFLQTDFESAASTGSAISAWGPRLCGNQWTWSSPSWRSLRRYQSSPSGLNTAHWVIRPE